MKVAAIALLGALVPGALSEEPAAPAGLRTSVSGVLDAVADESATKEDNADAAKRTVAKRRPSRRRAPSRRRRPSRREAVPSVPDTFEPAMPLDFFRNIDESKFEWVDKDEIRPGETTCGFLNAPLGWPNGSEGWHEANDDFIFPNVDVYVCVKFAKAQPAPRGNMAVHCGGPGALSACVNKMDLGDAEDTYNVIGFDQRGMGRSEPTFLVEECASTSYDECRFDRSKMTEEEELRAYARCYKTRTLGCWKYPGFQLESEDDSNKMYHFLEYSGTRQLAEDIERVRILFGGQKLSIYGESYGTKVFGTYATIFPKNVGLMVLDANDDPGSDIVSNTEDVARFNSQRIDYFIASCEFTSECHVPNMRGCINRLDRIIDANQDDISDLMKSYGVPARKKVLMNYVIQFLFIEYGKVDGICEAAEEGDYEQVRGIIRYMLKTIYPDPNKEMALLWITRDDIDRGSKPTPDDPSAVQTSVAVVSGQDYAFGAYDEDLYVRSMLEWRDKYSGAGTRIGAAESAYAVSYYFPNVTPLAPIGNPQVRGIIAGQMYDPKTPYIWTQKMRERFPLATLLTSRSVNHGMEASMLHGTLDPVCHGHIQRYFKTGVVGINDGHVCESDPIGDSCTINQILAGNHCLSPANGGRTNAIISTE